MISDAGTLADERQDRPGLLLRRAREGKGMSIGEVAEVTRVAQRQLEAIERSDFSSLPGTPYAVGFARAYARAVGADEVEIARGVREELDAMDAARHYEAFEPVDPARIPPRRLAWTAAAVALMLALGYGVWRTQFFASSTDQEISDLSNRAGMQPAVPAEPVQPPQIAAAMGPVVLTATDDVWLRVYEKSGARLLEKEMAEGESYTVPPTAVDPLIMTGRPDALTVTVGGKAVPPLGPPSRTVVDLPISAAALLARSSVDAATDASASAGLVPVEPSRSAASTPPAPAANPGAEPRAPERQVAANSAATLAKPVQSTQAPAPVVSNSAQPAVQAQPSVQNRTVAAPAPEESGAQAPADSSGDN